MAEVDAGPAPTHPLAAPLPALEERERNVLAELGRDVDQWVSFQGLRRQLGVHQQALARVLRRLAEHGLVAHEGKGYHLTTAGHAALRGAGRAPERPVLPVLQALLPPHVQPRDVAAQLSRRWFGGLRWYGQSEGPGETSLHWMAGQARVTVRVAPGSVHLEVEDDGQPAAAAFAAARPVLAALSEIYGASAS
jgi:DNA-binding IclR family transcriptional regulator